MKPRVVLRADGNAEIGYGHVIRSLAVASMIREEFDCFLAVKNPDSFIKSQTVGVTELVCLNGEGEEEFFHLLPKFDIAVLDGYQFGSDLQEQIKDTGTALVCITDFTNREYICDVIVNHAPGLSQTSTSKYPKQCFGLDYAMIRPAFYEPIVDGGKREGIFICFGGADFKNITSKLVKILQQKVNDKIFVVTGNGFKFHDDLAEISEPDVVEIYHSLNVRQLKELMDRSKLAIVPASTILYEVLARQLPAISGYYVDNQENIWKGFRDEGHIFSYGDFNDLQNFITYFEGVYSILNTSYFKPKINGDDVKSNYLRLFHGLIDND